MMTLSFTLQEDDFLDYQLYLASTSERIKKKRRKNLVLVPLSYAAFGLFAWFASNQILAAVFIVLALLWIFIYPIWERRRYINHYRAYIRENYKARAGKVATLTFTPEYVFVKDQSSEGKVLSTELEVIIEIPSAIFLKLKNGQAFIIPKRELPHLNEVRVGLRDFAAILSISYQQEESWAWK